MDRDGTISEEVGYVDCPSRFQVYPFASTAIKLLNDAGWLAIVITNQSGVARGFFAEAMVGAIHEHLTIELANASARLDAIYYCPHHPSIGDVPYRIDCDCRKPKPGLILKAAQEYNIDLAQSWMIGDRYSDIELARNAGVHSALVLSGYGSGEWVQQQPQWQYQPELVSEDLLEAVRQIVAGSTFRTVS
jgi:D-glycero-D-manno-heptose 1,7-bisphosphate phosphatase